MGGTAIYLKEFARKLSVVIPSRTAENVIPCVGAVRQREPLASVRVVWDISGGGACINYWDDTDVIAVTEAFCFSRNVNRGIQASGSDDVVILNDDALLQTRGGFSILAQSAAEHPEFGLIAATTNVVGNLNQRPQGVGLREDPRMVCFVCVYIPRSTIETVGLLDERFGIGGFEDDDYCLRVRRAGLKIGIHDGVFVDHGSLVSTIRGPGGPGYNPRGAEIFREKWGAGNHEV